jgi:hypothetical protein
MSPRAGLDDVENILNPTGTRTPTPLSTSPPPVAVPTVLSRLIYCSHGIAGYREHTSRLRSLFVHLNPPIALPPRVFCLATVSEIPVFVIPGQLPVPLNRRADLDVTALICKVLRKVSSSVQYLIYKESYIISRTGAAILSKTGHYHPRSSPLPLVCTVLNVSAIF